MSGTPTAGPAARPRRKRVVGTVVSDKMQKTVVVEVQSQAQHPLYRKYLRQSTRCFAHDEKGEAALGDRVEIAETRPLSRKKRWCLVRVVARASGGAGEAPGPEAPGTNP